MENKSATTKIKEWLEKGRPLTSVMAIQMFSVTCLPSVIRNLRKNGMNIESVKKANGSGHSFVEYRLK